MKLVRPKFVTARLIVALVILAVLCWAEYLRLLSASYSEKAEDFRVLSSHHQHGYPDPKDLERWNQYYDQMIVKYERASRLPWISVEPDPPEPE